MPRIDPERLIDELVDANHILFHQGVVDGFGHVSARDPGRSGRFLLARSMAPALVTRADILRFDADGNAGKDTRTPYLERFIHAEIYRARPDVMAVVHSHSPCVIPFGVASATPLRAICHMSGFLGAATGRPSSAAPSSRRSIARSTRKSTRGCRSRRRSSGM